MVVEPQCRTEGGDLCRSTRAQSEGAAQRCLDEQPQRSETEVDEPELAARQRVYFNPGAAAAELDGGPGPEIDGERPLLCDGGRGVDTDTEPGRAAMRRDAPADAQVEAVF